MKVFVWLYIVVFVILTPLFIYDMYVEKKINISFIVGLFLLFIFYNQFFNKGNTNKEDKKKENQA